jgi:AraC-like DNA-binding protein
MPALINIFLLLFGGLQGILLSIFLIRKRIARTAYGFLIGYILVMLLQILLKVVSKIWLMENMENFYFLSYRFPYLYGPLVYLFTVHLLKPEAKVGSKELLHGLPFCLAVFVMFAVNLGYMPGYKRTIFADSAMRMGLQLLSIALYHVLAFRLWLQYGSKTQENFSGTQRLQFRWLRTFIILSALICSAISVAIYFMYLYYPALNGIRFAFVLLTVFIYWISYCAMNQPELFSVIHGKGAHEPVPAPRLTVHRPPEKYQNSGLREEEMERILLALQDAMQRKKLYLQAELSIEDLATAIGSNRYHLSQVLNNSLRQSFYDYINVYRVGEAKLLLSDAGLASCKIAAIAYDAGFNSLSTFNEVFKKLTGITPSQYRKLAAGESRKQRV